MRRISSSRLVQLIAGLHVVTAIAIFACARPMFAQGTPAGTASLGGTVLSDPAEKPLKDAEIQFTKLGLNARSDSAGNFVITGIPAGRHEVTFKLIGYEAITSTLMFNPGQKVEGDFLLKQLATTLGAVNVKGAAAPPASDIRAVEFEERRKRGVGRFITADVFEKSEGRLMSDVLLTKVPGVHANIIGGSSGKALASGRSSVSISGSATKKVDAFDKAGGAKEDCYIQIIINGSIMYQLQPGRPLFDINSIQPGTVSGIEYYTEAQTPSQFQGTGSSCGTLLLWTRAR